MDGARPQLPGDDQRLPERMLRRILSAATVLVTLGGVLFGPNVIDFSARVGSASVHMSTRRAISVRVGTRSSTSAWPDATNTGVPAGTTLTSYGGSCDITVANTVIDSKTVNCPTGMSIQAANVTISKSRVTGLVRLDPDTSGYNPSWSITVTDSVIDAGLVQQAALCCTNMDVLRSGLLGGQTGAQCEVGLFCRIRNSYLAERAVHTTSWHLGGFLSDGTGGSSCTGIGTGTGLCIEMTGNTLWCDVLQNGVPDDGCSGDLQLIPNFARIENVKVDNNFFRANIDSAFCTFGGDKSDSTWRYGHNVSYTNNVFERGVTGICAAYGPVTDFGYDSTNNPGNVWSGNKYDDGVTVDPF